MGSHVDEVAGNSSDTRPVALDDVHMGGTSRQVSGNQAGSFGRSTSGGQDTGSIWLFVEEVQ